MTIAIPDTQTNLDHHLQNRSRPGNFSSFCPTKSDLFYFRYQNIDDGDVRELGVGYYNFSADGSTREKQMEMLDTLRHSTVETRKEKQDKDSAINIAVLYMR